MISDWHNKNDRETNWYGLNINSRRKVFDSRKFLILDLKEKIWYNKMAESIYKNNELENEMTLDMSYFWYSDNASWRMSSFCCNNKKTFVLI